VSNVLRTWGRRIVPVTGLALLLTGVGVALAAWSTTGTGNGLGIVGTLAAPTNVAASASFSTVTVTWDAVTPPDGVLDGYVVRRSGGGPDVDACGTSLGSPATYIPAGTETCSETSVPDGSHTYTVVAVYRTWTAQSSPSNVVSVSGDPTDPSQTVTMANATGAALVGSTVYFRSGVAGGFQLDAAVSDADSGPASATFPAVTASGWAHAAETVSTGVGTNPMTYTSSPFTWTSGAATPAPIDVVGRDADENTITTTIDFQADDTGPTGGALTVNGIAATSGGSTSTARLGFPINVRTDFSADAGSGFASSVLTRETAPFTGGTCGSFGSSTTITGNPTQTGLTTGCYRYTLTGTDQVGNTSSVSTVVRYDATAPTQSVSLSSAGGASLTGTNIYTRSAAAGSFTLTSAVTDDQTGPASVVFPAIVSAGWTHPAQTVTAGAGSAPTVSYTSSTYSWTAGATRPANTTLTAADQIGNTGTTALAFVTDNTAPTGSVLTVNGVGGTGAGSTSFNRTGAFSIVRTDYTDAGSGIASSTLSLETASLAGNVCGTYGAPTVLSGAPAQSGLTTGCYRYRLTGLDKVGNTASRTTVVKVDRELPVGGALTVNGTAASGAGTTSTARSAFPIDVRTDWTDAGSGINTSNLVRTQATLTNNTCGTFGTATTLTGTPLQTGLATRCYRYVLTGTDRAGNAASVTTIVKYDATNPVSGALTVNGVAATAAGSSSTSTGASYAIARTDYTDANSGLASSTLTREFATLTGTTCGAYGAPVTLTGAPSQSGLSPGCYRYRLTGVDNAGNSVNVSTVVQRRVVVTAVSLVNGTGVAGRIDTGDRIDITFSDALAVASVCSTWSGNGSDQTLAGDNNVAVLLTNGGAGNDTLTFSATSCTLNIGSLNLGNTGYATANVTFRGTGVGASQVQWSVGSRTLSVTLGTASGGGATTVASSTPVMTPSTALTNPDTVPVGGTFTLPNAQHF
jgi:hypothetical protein